MDLSVILFIPGCEFSYSLSESNPRLKAKIPFKCDTVGIGGGHIPRLHGHKLLVRLEVILLRQDTSTDELFLQDLHKVQEVFGLATANVVDFVRRNGQAIFAGLLLGSSGHHTHDAFHDIVHVGKIAATVAVVVNLDGLAFQQFIGKPKVGHVGPSCGTIHGEEPQAGAGDVVELAVAMRHEFVALLGGGIERDGIVHAVVSTERHFLVAAIHAATAGIYQVFHRIVAACLQDVIKTYDVALNIHIGVLNAITNACLCGQVYHNVKLKFCKQAVNEFSISNAALHELVVDVSRFRLIQLAETILFKRRIVVVVKVVNAHNRAFRHIREKAHHQVGPYESRRTCYQYCPHY